MGALEYCLSASGGEKCKNRVSLLDLQRVRLDGGHFDFDGDGSHQRVLLTPLGVTDSEILGLHPLKQGPSTGEGGWEGGAREGEVMLAVGSDCSAAMHGSLTFSAHRWEGPRRFVVACTESEWASLVAHREGHVQKWLKAGGWVGGWAGYIYLYSTLHALPCLTRACVVQFYTLSVSIFYYEIYLNN